MVLIDSHYHIGLKSCDFLSFSCKRWRSYPNNVVVAITPNKLHPTKTMQWPVFNGDLGNQAGVNIQLCARFEMKYRNFDTDFEPHFKIMAQDDVMWSQLSQSTTIVTTLTTIVTKNLNCRNANLNCRNLINHNCRNFFERFLGHVNINTWSKDYVSLDLLNLNSIFTILLLFCPAKLHNIYL